MRRGGYVTLVAVPVALAICGSVLAQGPVGSAFTYQGQLKEGGVPANGDYDFVFRLFNDPDGGTQVGSDIPVEDWPVMSGLFTVELDFGPGAFTGDARWLQVAVRPGDSTRVHTALSPRQPVSAAPYALYAVSGPGGSGGDWAANGSHIYNTNPGYVGIGTTHPARQLHVQGHEASLRLDRDQFGPGVLLTRTAPDDYDTVWKTFTVGTMVYGENDGRFLIGDMGTDTAGAPAERLVIDNEGDVGIGTSSPNAKLHVEGGTDVQPGQGGYLVLGPTSDANLSMDVNEIMARNNGAVSKLHLNAEGGDVVIGANGDSKLGVGTSEPWLPLHVEGNAFVNGDVLVSGKVDIGYELVESASPSSVRQWSVSCPSGKKVLGGGCWSHVQGDLSYPMSDGSGWECWAANDTGGIRAYAICADVE